jgi:methylmalonyl-CoA/ethylmalonyl-CoA epimerase
MSATIPMLTRIDHVGIACKNLEETVDRYHGTFSLEVVSFEVNEAQGVREAMLGAGPGYIQLLEPLGPDTPVGKFLARRGEGIHHIGYGVDDIEATLKALGGKLRLIDERPRHGSMGASIAFLHPADLGGVLTELVQSLLSTHRCEQDLPGRIGCRTLKDTPTAGSRSSVPVTG